ncbi:uncharacterized protein P174DRAFT_465111 [Aspergillus novofumigatus IBT 16806]|uniref:Uncharacterized protein n=1 Tax=Aspergillus novofumigatus (strain IBT 16806) TaxID=1392255 RepID=A0A2I1BT74_ASPN1|nr:uncharacterized protein P174DRAFT_465111 [Aspergillus novofumigatus IBT 16806]PKX88603.1 hypothetical protein P174DRAFT_465111 [Aspergillus novofumigatus IBT 16806]
MSRQSFSSGLESQPRPSIDSCPPFWCQFLTVTKRAFQHTWRTPLFIYSKLLLCTATSLFISLVFLNSPLSIQGLQNQIFTIFKLMSIVGRLRSLYKARKRPSKTYSWKIPWCTLSLVFIWLLFYFPIGVYQNTSTAEQGPEQAAGVLFAGSANNSSNITNFCFILAFFFCTSLLLYYVSAVLLTGLANFTTFNLPAGKICGKYIAEHITAAGGYLLDGNVTSNCQFCKVKETNVYLAGIHANYGTRGRNFGIMWVYIAFNVVATLFLYWVARAPKARKLV